ncbi:MAG: acyl-CoA dehydrogenase family protein [Pseudomonadota bacterium]
MSEQLPSPAAVRHEVRVWLDANWNPAWRGQAQEGPDRVAWLTQVVDAGWAAPQWPAEWFGRDYDDERGRIVEEEFSRVGAFGTGQDRTNLWINTLLAFGTDALKRELLPGLMRGTVNMCLLYSEPGAGSDLAGVRTRVERDGDEWVVNGQKVWTSGAASADYGMLIARTDWDAPKHRGLSFFFLPMKQPGVEVRPLRQVTNESHFNEVFITDARAPAANLLGREGEGWKVLVTALSYERSVMGEGARGPRSGQAVSKQGNEPELVALAREASKLDDPVLRQRLAQVVAWDQLNALNNARAKADVEVGSSTSIMSLGKLAMSRILHESARLRTDLLGAGSLLEGADYPRSEDANFLALNAYFTSIGGGTDQVQRNIISERVLGLPKEPEVDKDVPFRDVKGG